MQTDRANRGDAAPEFIHASSYHPVARRLQLLSERSRRLALIAALVVPAAIILYLLATVRPVAFQLSPENATLTLAGGPTVTLGGRRFLRHGSYRLQASAPDHHDGELAFEVVAGSGIQRIELRLVPLAQTTPDPAPMFGNATLPATPPASAAEDARDGARAANTLPTPAAAPSANEAVTAGMPEAVAEALPERPAAAPRQELEEVPAEPGSDAASPVPAEPSVELVAFAPVRYTMGSSRREHGRRANEIQREVALSRPFLLARYEISTRAYREFKPLHKAVTATGEPLDLEEQAVANVSWQDAALYCNWLSAREQLPPFYRIAEGKVVGFDGTATGYRLPSDAEWEWAARGQPDGALLRFAWGDEFAPPRRFGNYADRSARPLLARILADYEDGFRVTAPPGSFAANAWGLFDLSGNV
ncbi:MAG: SUMF1/EgtB/PvdO family nonheme iron enzyme, partial [Gammaproteobacteria bacterium]|nr:SUMF1/EgtB/PvdO family nonheme iron enzyme [Gammaproteobacteria bacterium]